MRWLVLVAAACSAPAKRERELPIAPPSDDRAMQLEGAGGAGLPPEPPPPAEAPGPAAEPPPPPAEPPAIAADEGPAEYELAQGARLHALPGGSSGHFAITADSRWVVYLDEGKLRSVRVDGLVERVIATGAVMFRLTGDSRYVVYGGPLARVPVGGGQPLPIAPGLAVASFGNFVVSPDGRWVAFSEASGDLAIASLADGTARRLQIPRPRDGRYHFGSGYVKTWSGDSKHLVYQHGDTYEVIGHDGRGRRPLEPNARGGEVVAHDVAIGIDERSYRIIPLDGGPVATIATPPLFGFSGPVIAPDARGVAFVAADYSLHYIDLVTRKLRRISPGGVRATSFLAFTPDGKQLLYVDMGPDSRRWCAVHAFELATSRDRVLATLRPGEQCFVKPAGNRRAVIHEWHQGRSGIRRQFLLVDLAGGPVRRLAPELAGAGNFDTSPDGRFVVFDRLREAPSMSLIRLP